MTNDLFLPDVPADAAGEPDAAVILAGSRILIRMDAGAPRLPRRGEAAADWSHVLRLGRLGDGACGAVEVAAETAVPGCEWRDLRPMLTALPEAERTAAARARELLNWRKRRRFCGLCGAVWYDKNEFETLVPNDGLILPTVTSGKAYRREMVLTLTADLRSGHLKVLDTGSLQMVMKASYHVPQSDIAPIISTLTCQKVISSDKKTGRITVLLAGK